MKRIIIGLLLSWSLVVQAEERILSYDSEIMVHVDGSMSVTETIQVKAERNKIKRGIYRDFPTVYTANGRHYRVEFQVMEVLRDGHSESWHTQRLSNGIRVYIGNKNYLLEPGEYTYRLTYRTDRQLGFFGKHDELYWNVTGNGWDFPIDRASARVYLPPSVPMADVSGLAYTGSQGSRESKATIGKQQGYVEYVTTTMLGRRQGLTIVTTWPKGFIDEPTREDQLRWWWRDEKPLFIIWGGILILLVYYWVAWLKVGRDPVAGIVIPEYEPPEGYSPAAIRLIRKMGYDERTLSAGLVSSAVKGALTLKENNDTYTAKVTGESEETLSKDERVIRQRIDGQGLVFKKSNHDKIRALLKAHEKTLDLQYRKKYFYSNRGWVYPGWLFSALILLYAGWLEFDSSGPETLFYLVFGSFVVGFTAPFINQLWKMRHAHQRSLGGWLKLIGAAVPLFFIGPFLGEFGRDLLAGISSAQVFLGAVALTPIRIIVGSVVILMINRIFDYLLKAPTYKGRKLLDHIEGFKQYLTLAEGDELRAKYAKPVTPETYEAYLPYAIALDVETEWAERFANDLRKAGQDPSRYRSHWYSGSDFTGVRGISSSVSSVLAGSISSSSTPPGSSSGGGGGGFSGGGGGGGGGGGW